eukprot:805975-Rhodomonas_salina.1
MDWDAEPVVQSEAARQEECDRKQAEARQGRRGRQKGKKSWQGEERHYPPGTKVDCLYENGTWYRGRVIGMPRKGKYRVRYVHASMPPVCIELVAGRVLLGVRVEGHCGFGVSCVGGKVRVYACVGCGVKLRGGWMAAVFRDGDEQWCSPHDDVSVPGCALSRAKTTTGGCRQRFWPQQKCNKHSRECPIAFKALDPAIWWWTVIMAYGDDGEDDEMRA